MWGRMFTAALFIRAKTWEQPKCPSIGKPIHKLWYIHLVKYVYRKKMNKVQLCSTHEQITHTYVCTQMMCAHSIYIKFTNRQKESLMLETRLVVNYGTEGRAIIVVNMVGDFPYILKICIILYVYNTTIKWLKAF